MENRRIDVAETAWDVVQAAIDPASVQCHKAAGVPNLQPSLASWKTPSESISPERPDALLVCAYNLSVITQRSQILSEKLQLQLKGFSIATLNSLYPDQRKPNTFASVAFMTRCRNFLAPVLLALHEVLKRGNLSDQVERTAYTVQRDLCSAFEKDMVLLYKFGMKERGTSEPRGSLFLAASERNLGQVEMSESSYSLRQLTALLVLGEQPKSSVCRVIGEWGGLNESSLLCSALAGRNDKTQVIATIGALGNIGGPKSVRVLCNVKNEPLSTPEYWGSVISVLEDLIVHSRDEMVEREHDTVRDIRDALRFMRSAAKFDAIVAKHAGDVLRLIQS